MRNETWRMSTDGGQNSLLYKMEVVLWNKRLLLAQRVRKDQKRDHRPLPVRPK